MKGVYFVRENLSKSHHIYYGREGIGDVHGFLTMEGKDEKGILNLLFIDSVNSKKLTDEIMKEVKAGKAKGGNVEQEKSSGEKTEPPLVLVVMILLLMKSANGLTGPWIWDSNGSISSKPGRKPDTIG